MSARRGMTLAEVLVSAAVFSLALIVLHATFVFGLRLLRQADSRSDTQRALLRFVARFQRDFQSAPWASVTAVYPGGNPAAGDLAVSWRSNRDASGQAMAQPGAYAPLYQADELRWRDGTDIRSLRLGLAPPTLTVQALPPATVIASRTAVGSTVELASVSSWQALDYVTGQPTALFQNPTRLALVLLTQDKIPVRLEFRCRLVH